MKLAIDFKNWQKLLVPEFRIEGISIEDRMVRVFSFNRSLNKIGKVGKYPLPAGIIEEGILKKPNELKAFFNSLKIKLWQKEKNIWAILSLPSANFYTNILSIPELDEERFKEAIVFNTQMVAPLPLEEVYFDWEDWGPSDKSGEREVFIVLGIKKQILSYLEVLESIGLKIIAVEPLALSLARFLSYFSEKNEPLLSVFLRNEGIEFILTEGQRLIFFDFDSWQEIFGLNIPPQISLDFLKKHIDGEVPMLLNFYLLKRKKNIEKFVFLSADSQMNSFLTNWITEQFKIFPAQENIPSSMKWVKKDWYAVIGTALRGIIPRYQDMIVSLAPVGTEESYHQNHLYHIFSLWTKVIISVLIVLTFTLGILDFTFFRNILGKNEKAVEKPIEAEFKTRETNLLEKAKEFNELVAALERVKISRMDLKKVVDFIFTSAEQNEIDVKRVFISAEPANNITVQGEALKKDFVLNWKNSIDKSAIFKESNIPLEALIESSQGVSFSLNLRL